jgi:hypothetical protein
MKTAEQIFKETMVKVKNLQRFEIKREVEPNWLPNGTIPFDVKASKGIAVFTVWAEFLQDAEDQVTQYLEKDTDE